MGAAPNEKTLQREEIIDNYLKTSKTTFNQFAEKKEKQIGEIDGAASALHLMKSWIKSINTLGSYASSTASNLKNFTKLDSYDREDVDGEDVDGKDIDGEDVDGEDVDKQEENGDDNDEQSEDGNEQEDEQNMNDLFSKLRKSVKDRILKNIIPSSLFDIKSKNEGLSSVLLNMASNLICQPSIDYNEMELMKLCLSKNINLMNNNYSEKYKAEIDDSLYKQIMKECEMRKPLPSSSVTESIDNLFDNLLQFRFDKNTNRIIQYLDDEKVAEKDKSSLNYQLLRLVQQVVFNFKFWVKESDQIMGNYSENMYLRMFAELLDIVFENEEDIVIYDEETFSQDHN